MRLFTKEVVRPILSRFQSALSAIKSNSALRYGDILHNKFQHYDFDLEISTVSDDHLVVKVEITNVDIKFCKFEKVAPLFFKIVDEEEQNLAMLENILYTTESRLLKLFKVVVFETIQMQDKEMEALANRSSALYQQQKYLQDILKVL